MINGRYVEDLARMMVQMHEISQANDCHISANTIWDIFDPNSDILHGYRLYKALSKEQVITH